MEPEPRDGECLVCFVARALSRTGCDHTLRHALLFRDLRVPAATGVVRRLEAVGGTCDCAIASRGYRLRRGLHERDVHTDELREPDPAPPCAEVPSTSARPCGNWVRPHRWDQVV